MLGVRGDVGGAPRPGGKRAASGNPKRGSPIFSFFRSLHCGITGRANTPEENPAVRNAEGQVLLARPAALP